MYIIAIALFLVLIFTKPLIVICLSLLCILALALNPLFKWIKFRFVWYVLDGKNSQYAIRKYYSQDLRS